MASLVWQCIYSFGFLLLPEWITRMGGCETCYNYHRRKAKQLLCHHNDKACFNLCQLELVINMHTTKI